jgi:parvulin-like peptidyl-prolyl isomerase
MKAVLLLLGLLCGCFAAIGCSGCDEGALPAGGPDAGIPPAGLTPEQAAQVVARVGDRTITLGDFAAVLERMNQFDRLRYESKERRRELLQELIDIELLAAEARRRGLDKKPEVDEAIRQILRDVILAKAREKVPPPAEIPQADVAAYYEKNKDKFVEPERRRVSTIVLADRAKADEALAKALEAKTGKDWGDLYFAYSIDAPKERSPNAPADLAGDRGIVGPPGDEKGANSNVPEPVRAAVFELAEVGNVHGSVVEDRDKLYVVRLSGLTKGHTRSLAEADRAIRVAILQEMVAQRERDLEAELRKRFPVQIDEAALAEIDLPEALESYTPYWEKDASGPVPPPAPAPGHEGHGH